MSKSKHSQAIIAFIAGFQHGKPTTGEISEALGLSSSRTRELLALELKAGTITRDHQEVDGAKILVYSVANAKTSTEHVPDQDQDEETEVDEITEQTESAENLTAPAPKVKASGKGSRGGKKAADAKPKAIKTPKAAKERKPRRKASGVGKPDAKKVINPQQTLDLKKAMVERNGGKMVWENRVWNISIKGKEGAVLKSREVAKHTLESLAKFLGIDA
jgi:hypothetical protein